MLLIAFVVGLAQIGSLDITKVFIILQRCLFTPGYLNRLLIIWTYNPARTTVCNHSRGNVFVNKAAHSNKRILTNGNAIFYNRSHTQYAALSNVCMPRNNYPRIDLNIFSDDVMVPNAHASFHGDPKTDLCLGRNHNPGLTKNPT